MDKLDDHVLIHNVKTDSMYASTSSNFRKNNIYSLNLNMQCEIPMETTSFSCDSTNVALCLANGSVKLYSQFYFEESDSCLVSEEKLNAIALQDSQIATGGLDHHIYLLNIENGKLAN